MEIDQKLLSIIEQMIPGDYAIFQMEDGKLRTLLYSPTLPVISGMTNEEFNSMIHDDFMATVTESDKPLVGSKLAELQNDPTGMAVATYRIYHKTRGFTWVRSRTKIIGHMDDMPVMISMFATPVSISAEYEDLINYTDTSIYVVDKNTHELLFVNAHAQNVYGGKSYEGALCYKYFNSFDEPCPWCSISSLIDGYAHIAENYVPTSNSWFSNDVHDIDWYGHDAAAFYTTNITEQKNKQIIAEERSKNLYQQITKANPDALAVFRLNMTKNTCSFGSDSSQSASNIKTDGSVDGFFASCAEMITDESIKEDFLKRFSLPTIISEFQNGSTEISIECPIESSSGDARWVNGIIIMFQNSITDDIEGVAYVIDITGRKLSDNILARISDERYDHIGLIDPSKRTYEIWSKDESYSLSPNLRVNYEATMSDVLDTFVHPDDRSLFLEHGNIDKMVERLDKDGFDTYVFRCPAENGDVVYKQVRYVWLNDSHNLILESQTDVTDIYEQQLEQVKQQHEAELAKERALNAESIPSGIGVFDVRGDTVNATYLNDGYYQMIGAEREQRTRFLGESTILAIHPDDRPGILQEAKDSIRDKRQFRFRFRILNGSGDYHWLEILANHVPLDESTERFYASYYDIDEMLRTQSELLEKEIVFKDIFTYSDILHFIYYPEARRYETEILPTRLGSLPKSMDDFPESFIKFIGLSPEDADAYRTMVQEIDDGAEESECTVRMIYGDRSGWYQVHMIGVPDEKGNITKAVGNVFNVDRTVEAERAIENETMRVESLRGLYLATASFNVTKDTETTFNAKSVLKRNIDIDQDELAEAMKYEPGVENQSPDTLPALLSAASQIPDREQKKRFICTCSHIGMARSYREGKRDITLEYRRILGDKPVWVSTRIILMSDPSTGDVLAFYYTRDITDQKKSDRISKLLAAKDCDYIALIDVGQRTFSFREVASFTESQLDSAWQPEGNIDYDQGMSYSIENFVRPEDQETLTEQTSLANLISKLSEQESYLLTFDRVDNRPGHDSGVKRKQLRYYWLDDNKDEILLIQTDVTAAYAKEQQRLTEMQEALKAAETANNSKNDFISRISHDIRTPIGAISNMTEFAFEDIDDRDKLENDLRNIQVSNTFLLSLINDVLDISKVDSGKIDLRPEPYPYKDFIANITDMFKPLCKEKNIDLQINVNETAPTAKIDPTRLNQIAMNLLSNAVKYTPAGGIVRFEANGTRRPDGKLDCFFRVSDTGIGMSDEFQKVMFEPFTQEYENAERDKSLSGTGLGLSIVKRIVDLMNGDIIVESALGKGTQITVSFTALEDSGTSGSPESQDLSSYQDETELSGTVLLVEDNQINMEIESRILESFGLDIVYAANGREAVDLFSASEMDSLLAIFMDIQMPVMNGYEATEAIRALSRPDAKTIPIIAMTADAFQEAVEHSLRSGMNGHVTKPLDASLIRKVLLEQLGR